MIIFEVMIKSIRNFLIIFFIFQQLQSQISQFDKNGLIGFCEQTLHILTKLLKKVLQFKFDLLYITLFSVFSTKIGIIRKLV